MTKQKQKTAPNTQSHSRPRIVLASLFTACTTIIAILEWQSVLDAAPDAQKALLALGIGLTLAIITTNIAITRKNPAPDTTIPGFAFQWFLGGVAAAVQW